MQQKFLLHKPITSNFIATSCINYCNDCNVIAMVFFVAINIFSCSAGEVEVNVEMQKERGADQVQVKIESEKAREAY